MPIPAERYKLLPLRGLKVNLDAGIADIVEGELCYATDEDVLYIKESGALVPTGANGGPSGSLSGLSDVSLSSTSNGEALIYNSGSWKNGGSLDGGSF